MIVGQIFQYTPNQPDLRRPFAWLLWACCMLLLNGCYMTSSLWRADNPSGDRVTDLPSLPATFSLWQEREIRCRISLPHDVLSSDGEGKSRTFPASTPLLFFSEYAASPWILAQAQHRGITVPVRVELRAQLAPTMTRAYLALRNHGDFNEWFTSADPDPEPDARRLPFNVNSIRGYHPLFEGLDRLQQFSWTAPADAKSNPSRTFSVFPVDWSLDGMSWSRDFIALSRLVAQSIDQRDFSWFPNAHLRFVKHSADSSRSTHLFRISLDRVLTVGALIVPLKFEPLPKLEGDDAPLTTTWFQSQAKVTCIVSTAVYEPLKTTGRVVLTPVTVCGDAISWTVVIVTAPLWSTVVVLMLM